jgi:hypothetical protein
MIAEIAAHELADILVVVDDDDVWNRIHFLRTGPFLPRPPCGARKKM